LGSQCGVSEPKFYSRILRDAAGKEPPAKGQGPTTEYQFLLPYFVLAGLAGIRTCELIRSGPDDPVLAWEDILWTKKLIYVRHEVAKQSKRATGDDISHSDRRQLVSSSR
jgi:hypothetical protein